MGDIEHGASGHRGWTLLWNALVRHTVAVEKENRKWLHFTLWSKRIFVSLPYSLVFVLCRRDQAEPKSKCVPCSELIVDDGATVFAENELKDELSKYLKYIDH